MWMQQHPGWLLILDNVEDRAHIAELLAQVGRHGHVVLTTRRDLVWKGAARPLSLNVLTAGESVELLATLTRREEPEPASALAEELSCLPLALDQAGAYIAQQRIPIAEYLRLLREQPARLFDRIDEGGDPARTIARVWQVTLDIIEERNPLAVLLLRVMAYYAPDNIPRDVLTGPFADPEAINEALGILASYSMITLTADAISIHRLVQAVLRTRSEKPPSADSPEDGPQPVAVATGLLDAAAPSRNIQMGVEDWPRWRALAPHIEKLADLIPDGEATSKLERVSWIMGPIRCR
jgi:hypothetical protein